MERENQSLNLDVDFDFDDFEDLTAEEAPEADGAVTPLFTPHDDRTPAQRISDLLQRMAPHRSTLMGILAFCTEPRLATEVDQHVEEKLQASDFSVFTAASMCEQLERAGALERIVAEGAEVAAEPKTVVEDGVEYLEIQEAPAFTWLITEDGKAVLDADDPLQRVRDLFAAEEPYQPIFKRILTMCGSAEGCTLPALETAVDKDPLVQEPRFYAPYFVELLDKCGALEWRKTWHLTQTGDAALELLVNVEDNPYPVDEKDAQ